MYSILDPDSPLPKSGAGGLPEALAEVLRLRQHIMERGEHLYCSVLIRSLIEVEIPRLITTAAARK